MTDTDWDAKQEKAALIRRLGAHLKRLGYSKNGRLWAKPVEGGVVRSVFIVPGRFGGGVFWVDAGVRGVAPTPYYGRTLVPGEGSPLIESGAPGPPVLGGSPRTSNKWLVDGPAAAARAFTALTDAFDQDVAPMHDRLSTVEQIADALRDRHLLEGWGLHVGDVAAKIATLALWSGRADVMRQADLDLLAGQPNTERLLAALYEQQADLPAGNRLRFDSGR